jgi:hypothetical protein
VGPLFGRRPLAVPALFIIAIYAWVWLRFRPSKFIVYRAGLQVIWPLKRREIPREDISNVRLTTDESCEGRSDGACGSVPADCGADSAGCGRSGGESYRCTSHALIVSCGSSELPVGRGLLHLKTPRRSFVPCRVTWRIDTDWVVAHNRPYFPVFRKPARTCYLAVHTHSSWASGLA